MCLAEAEGIPLPCFASHEFATFCGKFLVRICHLFTKQNKPAGYAALLSLAEMERIPLPCFASQEFRTFCGKFLVRICHLFTKQNKPAGYADLLSLAKATEFDTISRGAAFCPFKGVHFFAGTLQLHISIVHKNEYYGIIK